MIQYWHEGQHFELDTFLVKKKWGVFFWADNSRTKTELENRKLTGTVFLLFDTLLSFLDYVANHGKKTKKKLLAPDISLTLDRSDGSVLSDELEESTELDLDAMDTPSDNSNEFEWEGKDLLSWKNTKNLCFSTDAVAFNTTTPVFLFLLTNIFTSSVWNAKKVTQWTQLWRYTCVI